MPFKFCTKHFTRASPRPVPWIACWVTPWPRLNLSNMWSKSSGQIPEPMLVRVNTSWLACWLIWWATFKLTAVSGAEYLPALVRSSWRMRSKLSVSVWNNRDVFGRSNWIANPLSAHFWVKESAKSWITGLISIVSNFKAAWFDSSCWSLSKSLIKLISWVHCCSRISRYLAWRSVLTPVWRSIRIAKFILVRGVRNSWLIVLKNSSFNWLSCRSWSICWRVFSYNLPWTSKLRCSWVVRSSTKVCTWRRVWCWIMVVLNCALTISTSDTSSGCQKRRSESCKTKKPNTVPWFSRGTMSKDAKSERLNSGATSVVTSICGRSQRSPIISGWGNWLRANWLNKHSDTQKDWLSKVLVWLLVLSSES